MAKALSQAVANEVASAGQLYHRVVLVVGPARSGKTSALQELNAAHGWPLVNVNLALAARLLELNRKQRALRVHRIIDDIVRDAEGDVILLDNIEMLFHPELKLEPLNVLLSPLSRNRTIVATWRGLMKGKSLVYAGPEHPEYRRYDDPQARIVTTSKSDAARRSNDGQEHSA